MNKPNKTKVPVVKEVRVKLKLRGVPQEPEPRPAPEPEVPVPPRDVTWLYDQDILDAQTMINDHKRYSDNLKKLEKRAWRQIRTNRACLNALGSALRSQSSEAQLSRCIKREELTEKSLEMAEFLVGLYNDREWNELMLRKCRRWLDKLKFYRKEWVSLKTLVRW